MLPDEGEHRSGNATGLDTRVVTPSISVFIPVKNGAETLDACLAGITGQTIPVGEVVIVDSGSTDDSLEIAARFPRVRRFSIAPESFNHGATRNRALELCRGDLILFTVQDAVPDSDEWLRRLLAGFASEAVSAVCGAQIVPPSPDTNPVDWHRPVSEPRIEVVNFESGEAFEKLPPRRKAEACGWDNVCAIYRRSALERIPFRQVSFGEDMFWAHDAFMANRTLAYNPSAKVRHYHSYDYANALKRSVVTHLQRDDAFGLTPAIPPTARDLARAIYRLASREPLTLRRRAYWLLYNIKMLAARHRGARIARAACRRRSEKESIRARYLATPPIPESARRVPCRR